MGRQAWQASSWQGVRVSAQSPPAGDGSQQELEAGTSTISACPGRLPDMQATLDLHVHSLSRHHQPTSQHLFLKSPRFHTARLFHQPVTEPIVRIAYCQMLKLTLSLTWMTRRYPHDLLNADAGKRGVTYIVSDTPLTFFPSATRPSANSREEVCSLNIITGRWPTGAPRV